MKALDTFFTLSQSTLFKGSVSLLHVFCLFLCTSIFGAVIQIDDIQELQKIGNDPAYPLSGEYELSSNIDASDTVNWNNGAGFLSIGTVPNPFIGKFNGKGHKITNLFISSGYYTGLFRYIGSAGEVKDLGVEKCWVVSENDYVGGLVGRNDGKILDCYTTGSVLGSSHVGGLVGLNAYTGTISNSYSTSLVWGISSFVGGLAGDNNGTISLCYSIGSVRGDSFVGGLVGYNKFGTVENSYWDTQTSGQITSEGGVGKTTEEMKQQLTYENWDFTSVWTIEEGTGYPYLQVSGHSENADLSKTRDINSLEELSKIGFYPDSPWWWNYELKADIDASATESWNEGKGFRPLRLTGQFHGNGHVISGLHITRSDENNIGLFGTIGSGGEIKDLAIEDCQIVGRNYVGSLVGWNVGEVSNSYSSGSVSGEIDGGGLIGGNFGGSVFSSYSTSSVEGSFSVGGLVGYNSNSGNIDNSYSTGSVADSGDLAGGLIGENWGAVKNCYHTEGSVSGTGKYLGGLVGRNYGAVSESYNNSSVEGTGNYIGGLVGRNDGGTISNSYNTGSLEGTSSVGGLVGGNLGGTVSESYSMGSVTGTENYVGGLVGRNDEGIISNSYNTGSVEGTSSVGGLVGGNLGGTVSESYSMGSVTGTGNYIGGLAGEGNGGTIENNYWDTQTSGQTTSAGGTGKITEEMKQKMTFVNWNFTTIWGIAEGQTYPYLLWQSPPTIEGEGTEEGTSDGEVISNEISILQEISGNGIVENQYTPGSTINIKITFTKNTSETITALGLTCLIPSGWQYQGGTNQPPIAPAIGKTSDGETPLDFAWITIPSFPIVLSFNVSIPNDAQGPCDIQSQSFYRLTDGQLYSNKETFHLIGKIESEGIIEGTAEGVVEGTTEGTSQEGSIEGEGEGHIEGEGTAEGIVEGTTEGTPQEGSVEGEGEDNCGCCGCSCSDDKDMPISDKIMKYLLDFIFVGFLVSIMCSMKKYDNH